MAEGRLKGHLQDAGAGPDSTRRLGPHREAPAHNPFLMLALTLQASAGQCRNTDIDGWFDTSRGPSRMRRSCAEETPPTSAGMVPTL